MRELNPAQRVGDFGQSIWYDNISRELLDSGEIRRLIAEWGVRGLTSNPAIFHKAITSGSSYFDDISAFKRQGMNSDEIFEELALADIAQAADELLGVYQASAGEDGYASIEVSPLLAKDSVATINEALRLYQRLSRPNIMIKVPGTKDCLPAIEELLFQGVNINVTLLFSVENYREVAQAYIRGLTRRHQAGLKIDGISSVASFFVSRVDSLIDANLAELGIRNPQVLALRGKAAIANAKIAYAAFQEIFSSDEFAVLRQAGARRQRPLWASTSTKNPAYRDVIYVDELIGPDTVNTVPHATLAAYVDHGTPGNTLESGLTEAKNLLSALSDAGINFAEVLAHLQEDGVAQFIKAFLDLREAIAAA
ncbi:MAG: transaldolase [bacterium]|nr:transaldolase [bacterium]